ncbi:MAG: HAD hydrolase-like protein [Gemmatimonadota bacterium]
MKRLILFDIDGTLLWTRGAAKNAFQRAMVEVYGTAGPIATHSFAGKTDPQIARELLRLSGFEDDRIDAGLDRLWSGYLRELREEFRLPGRATTVLPGVRPLLDELGRRADTFLLGLLTGNIEEGASLKLRSAALDCAFRLGAYGSDRERREDLPEIAVERALSLTGVRFRGREIVIIGDTPADMTCGAALDAFAFGVATGYFDEVSLRAAGAHFTVPDLGNTQEVLDVLLPG